MPSIVAPAELARKQEMVFLVPALPRGNEEKCYPPQQDFVPPVIFADGGTSLAGFSLKKPLGFNMKPMYAVGMTG